MLPLWTKKREGQIKYNSKRLNRWNASKDDVHWWLNDKLKNMFKPKYFSIVQMYMPTSTFEDECVEEVYANFETILERYGYYIIWEIKVL